MNDKKISWSICEVNIKELKEHPKNPRQISKHHFQHLTKLIDKFGMINKIIVNRDMTIIGGHQRLKVLKKLKHKTCEVSIPSEHLSDKEVEELLIGLNLNQGSFDYDILANQFEAIDLLEAGFTEDQLFGHFDDEIEEGNEEEEKSKKKKKECPNCGHIM